MHPGMPSAPRRASARALRWLPVLGAVFLTGSYAIPATSIAPRAIAAIEHTAATPDNRRAHRHCTACGRVVDIRRIEATATAPVSFEFTVRMRDGTLHLSPAADMGRWQVGDGIMLLGGTP
jgi:hypothetical protein